MTDLTPEPSQPSELALARKIAKGAVEHVRLRLDEYKALEGSTLTDIFWSHVELEVERRTRDAGLADLEARLEAAGKVMELVCEQRDARKRERDEARGRLKRIDQHVARRTTWFSYGDLLLEIGRLATEPPEERSESPGEADTGADQGS